MAEDIKATIRRILLDTVVSDTYGRTADGDFVSIRWEESPLLNEAVERIMQAIRKESVVDQAMNSLTKGGNRVGMMQCNNCDFVSAWQPTDVTAEQLERQGKKTIMRLKEHFEAQKEVCLLCLRFAPCRPCLVVPTGSKNAPFG